MFKFVTRAILLVFLCSASLSAHADDPAPVEVPAGELITALESLARQIGVELVYRTEQLEGLTTRGVSGTFSAEDAIKELLEGTPLALRIDASGAMLIAMPRLSGNSTRMNYRDAVNGAGVGEALAAQSDATGQPRAEDRQDPRQESSVGGKGQDRQIEEIVVTGTHLRGVAPDSSPSFVFDRGAIEQSGYGTVEEFVQSLPQTFGGGSQADVTSLPSERNAGFNNTFGSSVNLRGTGSGATLVLLNGRRLAPAGRIGDFVDISMIPLSAVERVEVLTDGASAIYGADAIAGVVNFVLRDDYDGAESFVRYGSVTDGDLKEYRVGQTLGKDWDSGNALVSYEFYRRDSLGAEHRDFSSTALLPLDLLPERKSHNILLSAGQRLTDSTTLRGHGFYSKRDASRSSTLIVTSTQERVTTTGMPEAEQYGAYAGADVDLWQDWLLDTSVGYHRVASFAEVIRPAGFAPNIRETESDLWSIDAKADGTILTLPGGEAKLAVGLSYRQESFLLVDIDADAIARKDDRDVFSAFGEAFVPLVGSGNRLPGVHRLEIAVAGRFEDYSDFGDTFNPKVGALWSPLEGLNLRATYGTSFNPPNLGDTGEIGGSAIAFNAPDPASPTGTSLTMFDFRVNPDLDPEESTMWTAGFDYRNEVGAGDVELSMTFFDISYDDRIDLPTNSTFAPLQNPVEFDPIIFRNPDPALIAEILATAGTFLNLSGGDFTNPGDEEVLVDLRLQNLARTDTSGMDFNLSYGVDAGFGVLNFALNASYLFNMEKRILPTSPVFDVVNKVFNPADLRMRGSASWSRDGVNLAMFVNHTSDYVDDRNVLGIGDVPVDSWTTLNINVGYDTADRMESGWLDNTRLKLSVLDLFNQEPPAIEIGDFSRQGFDTANADPLGRFIAFQITKEW